MVIRRFLAGAFVLSMTACGAHQPGTGFAPAPASNAARQGDAFRDVGRSARQKPVSVVVLLKYRNRDQLDRLTARASNRTRPISREQFIARYAPTVAQERQVIEALRAQGFAITRRYANRTIIDAAAPAVTVERTFATEIHDFATQRHGRRFAAVKPVIVPARLAGLVQAVNVDTVVRMRVADAPGDIDAAPVVALPDMTPDRAPDPSASSHPAALGANIIGNPGFETGRLAPWESCASKKSIAPAAVTNYEPHSGRRDAYAGTYQNGKEPPGVVAVCQLVTIPNKAKLSFWIKGVSSDPNPKTVQFVAFYKPSGKVDVVLFETKANDRHWVKKTYNLSAYAGRQDYLLFGVIGSRRGSRLVIGQYVDDVSLIGTLATPSPSPSPSSTPTAPPVSAPGCRGSATPAPNFGPNGGWGPSAVSDGLSMGPIYCYYGKGQTIAVIMDATPSTADITAYMTYFNITRTGTITTKLIDGGDASPSSDSLGEVTLDVETTAGLATAANIIVYEVPALDDQSVEDAYNQVLSDGVASVATSSFSGCESQDPSYDSTTDAIAEQGAATGVTFAASSGDQGVDCYEGDFVRGVGAPASDPHFVGVGGSQSTSSAAAYSCGTSPTAIGNPVVWSDCVGAGGSGISTVWPLPTYQSAYSSASGRVVPDVSLPAAGIDVYQGGEWGTYWGTSWSSPMYAAMQAEVNQECGENLWGISELYGALGKDPSETTAFVDVTSGTNPYQSDTGYSAAVGFDEASGIGIPLGVDIAYEACGATGSARR